MSDPEPKKDGLFDDFFKKDDPENKYINKESADTDEQELEPNDYESQLPMSTEEQEGYADYVQDKIIEEEIHKEEQRDKAIENLVKDIEEKPPKPPVYLQTSQKLDQIIDMLKRNQNKGELVELYQMEEYLLAISERTPASAHRKETDATRQIGGTKFRFKDLKNIYKLIEILKSNDMLFKYDG
ncbi:MAG: hypothetical protein ACXAC2_00480 [Candidatus Kariarchaeaceae archaeon]|jgi:hypothetical protein